jgi:hypothetical protein
MAIAAITRHQDVGKTDEMMSGLPSGRRSIRATVLPGRAPGSAGDQEC